MEDAAILNMKRMILLLVFMFMSGTTQCDILELSSAEFQQFINSNSLVMVLFKASSDCPDCNRAMEYFVDAPQPELVQQEIEKRWSTDEELAAQYGADDFPAVVFFRDSYPALYDGELSSVDDIPEFADWMEKAVSIATKDLNDDSFEHLTQASTGATTGDWFVLFYKPSCEDCLKVFPALESAAIRVKHRMNFAKVDTEANKNLLERFNIKRCPTGILFRQGKMYEYEPDRYDPWSLVSFVDGWYRNVKARPVPTIPTAFDKLTDSIAMFLKEQTTSPDRKWIVFAVAGCGAILLVAMVIFICKKPSDSRRKFD